MATTKRQALVTALDTRLKTIKTTAGYETSVGSKVFEWLARPVDEADTPCLVWRDTDDTVDITVGLHEHRLNVDILCFATGATSPATIRSIIADVTQALNADRTFGGVAEDTILRQESMTTEHLDKFWAAAIVGITILFTTAPFNAYS